MRLLSTLKILSLAICVALLMSCEKKDNSVLPYLKIISPDNNEIFFNTEVLSVDITTNLIEYQINNVAFYVDDILVEELQGDSIVCKIELDEHNLGEHTIKVILHDEFDNSVTDTKKIIIYNSIGESPDSVNFSEGMPDTWRTDSWEINSNLGFEGSQSMQITNNSGSLIATKTFAKEGNINFRIKNDSGELFFYIDGKLKSKWFGEEDWFDYSYYVGEGNHTFKWKSNSPTIILDDVNFVEDKIAHSIGEYFGGGIIYFLDSSKEHGLIASLDDLGTATWGCSDTTFHDVLDAFDGAKNTQMILSLCDEEGIAARLCTNYVVVDENIIFDDWFLPATKQLFSLYEKREIVGYVTGGIYWTSFSFTVNIERYIIVAGILHFMDGSSHGAMKTSSRLVRPIRAF